MKKKVFDGKASVPSVNLVFGFPRPVAANWAVVALAGITDKDGVVWQVS